MEWWIVACIEHGAVGPMWDQAMAERVADDLNREQHGCRYVEMSMDVDLEAATELVLDHIEAKIELRKLAALD
jgi:hypothetical protein